METATPWQRLVLGDHGIEYEVVWGEVYGIWGYECTCPAWRYNVTRPCKHIERAKKAHKKELEAAMSEAAMSEAAMSEKITVDPATGEVLDQQATDAEETVAAAAIVQDVVTIDPRFWVDLRGRMYPTWPGVLDAAHRLGLSALQADLVQAPRDDNGMLAVVRVTAELKDGRTFAALGDASPQNCSKAVVTCLVRMAECVPLRAEILTRDGWKRHSALQIGEEVLAYNPETDYNEWTALQAVTVYPSPMPTTLLSSRSFRATVTPEHTWMCQTGRGERGLVRTCDLENQSILMAARSEGGDHPLTAQEAAILGWVATDGTARMSLVGERWGPYLRVCIRQSKPHYVAELRGLLGDAASESVYQPKDRDFGSHVSSCLPAYTFDLHAGFARDLLSKAGLYGKAGLAPWTALSALVLQLSEEARAAMLAAMLKGDGTRKRESSAWEFGKKAKPGVMEAFELLATLEGRALGVPRQSTVGEVPLRTLRVNRRVCASYLTVEPGPAQAVWCPTTAFGTWVMRLDGCITITGNTRAKGRALRDMLNIGTALLEELPPDAASAGKVAPHAAPHAAAPTPNGAAAPSKPAAPPKSAPPKSAPPKSAPSDDSLAACQQPGCAVILNKGQAALSMHHYQMHLCPKHQQYQKSGQKSPEASA
jgi:hypothetical protein